ncbi:MAG TPA: MBL fold metallo-hydrolase [Vicinamibacteria bacterium]|nr:MBL fold metallo-hydrolase [Vicinamibacteria bacterium]
MSETAARGAHGQPPASARVPHPPDPARAGLGVTLPFFARRAWVSLRPRPGAAPRVDHDPAALQLDPGVTWIGHASFHVRLDGASFLTDPMFSERASPLSFAGPPRLVRPGVPLDELPHVDFALVSHDHYDHADLPTLRALVGKGVRLVVPLGMADVVRQAGADAIELGWWEHVDLAGVRVHCVPAQHFSGRGLTDRGRRLWAGFVVEGRTRRFYHAGDTGYFGGFAQIAARLGPIGLAALPIGAYRPVEMMRPVHMDPEEAVRAALDLGTGHALAMHFGTFDLTDEPLDEPPSRFLAEAARRGLGDRAWVLRIGETRRW